MSDIFREVEEELRQDKLRAFWKQHGWLVIIAAVGIVLGVAGTRGWQAWERSQVGASGARYTEALQLLEDDKDAEGLAILGELAEDSYASYPVLARLREAGALSATGDKQAAVEAYDTVASDSGADDTLRDVARIRAALILVDSASADEIKSRVGALADIEDGPWRHSARELIALSLYHAGEYASADAEYDRVMGDPGVPVSLRGRAEMMRALIAPHLAGKAG